VKGVILQLFPPPHSSSPSPLHSSFCPITPLSFALCQTLPWWNWSIMAVGKDKVKRLILEDFDVCKGKGCRGWNVET
jgi:hypothetical protein